jgi:hypothetical protein
MRTKGTGSLWSLALAVAAFLPLEGACSPARAGPITLQDLLEGQTIRVADKEFSGFAAFTSVVAGGAVPVNPSAVMVEPFTSAFGVGLRFLGGTEFNALVGSQVTSFRYSVSSLLPIVDFELGMSGGVGETGGVSVLETIRDPGGNLLESETVFLNPDDSKLQAMGTFPGQFTLDVNKSIRVSGPGGVSEFFQTFSQIPEPPTLTLLGIGTLCLVGSAAWRSCRSCGSAWTCSWTSWRTPRSRSSE